MGEGRAMGNSPDAGQDHVAEVSVADAYAALGSDPRAVLVDVRTRAEWGYVGLPDLADLGKAPLLQEWQVYPEMQVDPGFVDALAARLAEMGLDRDAPLYFLCRSGVRSHAAALAMGRAGHARCHNVAGGFEGPRDGAGHRGALEGWKAAGLPWSQS